ncbi:hypothetical protein KsCSTR_29830 [Candidatus Kuenenia stuttgartiensis]|jgi:hypothetical protein|nr:addiction module protein [Planctomycetia bacterium]QII12362.1 hypothetical protein KsCSTR_29830 [Candidatus Kuenenia stuttgartiensis]TVM02029.1 MAG: hypothetical protein CV080_02305 [Candidatus Kuenenia stuttgartiensis]SOH06284.1 hypothetical protein KSMBR1_3811 [Candidatus Kuenenia stuttgartiensis]
MEQNPLNLIPESCTREKKREREGGRIFTIDKYVIDKDLISFLQIDSPDPEIDRIWAEEARNRCQAYKTGKFETVSYENVMSKQSSCRTCDTRKR